MKNQILNLCIASTTLFGMVGCCGYRVVTCPDSRPVNLPKSESCSEKIYKDAVKQLDLNFKATVDIIEKIKVGVDNLNIKNDAVLLKEKLNQESIRFEAALKASFQAIRIDPCGNSANHYKLLESLSDKNYKLLEMKTQLSQLSTSTNEVEIQTTLDNYSKGKIDGANMKALIQAIDNYFIENQKYPNNLEDLNLPNLIKKLGNGRLDYKLEIPNKYTLRFAGEDYVLKTPDDKIYVGDNGSTTKQSRK